jgi:non-canonical poly(A) RNA polymerase PAPD5/7
MARPQGDRWRPNFGSGRPPPEIPQDVRDSMFSLIGVRGGQSRQDRMRRDNRDRDVRSYQKLERQRRQPHPRTASSRPLLQQSLNLEERVLRDTSAADKFRNLDEITDSDEDDMSQSDNDVEDSRPSKRAKVTDAESSDAAAPPKWSNPDPYTALPPPAETSGKRIDVLKLIRKAKIDQEKKEGGSLDDNDDFISFGDFDGVEQQDDEILQSAPNGPRRRNPFKDSQLDGSGQGQESTGKRKRGAESAIPRPPAGYLPADQLVLKEWKPRGQSNAVPWYRPAPNRTSPGIA